MTRKEIKELGKAYWVEVKVLVEANDKETAKYKAKEQLKHGIFFRLESIEQVDLNDDYEWAFLKRTRYKSDF